VQRSKTRFRDVNGRLDSNDAHCMTVRTRSHEFAPAYVREKEIVALCPIATVSDINFIDMEGSVS
jgi:hypothetical protein